jgi:enoyl-CoA hydratase/carnithine racemase
MSDIIFKEKKNIAILTLSREKTLNAWTSEMRKQICKIFSELKKKKHIKAIIITGSGKKAFCSGQDLNEIKNFKSKNVNQWINEFKQVYIAIRSAEIPVIAAINGVAAGSGFQLALLTDIRVSHSKARFGQVEINSGVVSIIGPWIIEKVLGMSKTIELCLTGQLIDGKEAKKNGIVHYLTERDKVMSMSLKIAKQLSDKPEKAMKFTKKRIWEMFKKDMNDVFEKAKIYHKESFNSGEPQKKSKYFLKK